MQQWIIHHNNSVREPYTIINDITVQDITSAVDLSQIPVGELQALPASLIIRVPEQVEVINISNETITVDVQVIEQTTDEQTE